MSSSASDHTPVVPLRGMKSFAVISAAGMQAMDTLVASIALPNMQGAFSATQEEISWVLSAFLIAVAIFTPLSGWVGRRIGRKRLMLIAIVGFVCCSASAGASVSLTQAVVSRFVQGIFGAALVPLSQQFLLDMYPRERHGLAMGWFSVGMMFGLIVGPTLGGYITEYYTWRWNFFINIPIGIMAFLAILIFINETEKTSERHFDFFGFFALAVTLGAFQLMLDRGEKLDWFSSPEIVAEACISATALYVFVIHIMTARRPFIDPALFRNSNFAIALLFIFLLGIMIFGYVGLLPPFLQRQLGYPVDISGLLMAPRGAGTMLASVAVGAMLARFEPRYFLVLSLLCMGVSAWWMSHFTQDVDSLTLMAAISLQGAGFGMFSVTVTTSAFATLTPQLRGEGTAMLALCRRMGASVGVSLLVSQLVRDAQQNHAILTEHIGPYNETFKHLVLPDAWSLVDPAGLMALEREISRQAHFLAYLYDFRLMALMVVVMLPMVLIVRSKRPPPRPAE